MIEKLLDLERVLINVGHPVINFLQAGLNEMEVEEFFSSLRLLAPSELVELYKWRNGVSNFYDHPSGRVDLLPLGVFFSFPLALEQYEEYKSRYGMHLWPIMGSGDSDNYLINLSHDRKNNGKIYFASIPLRRKPFIRFPSLSVMVDILVECYSNGAYFIDNESFLEVRHDLEDEILSRFGVPS